MKQLRFVNLSKNNIQQAQALETLTNLITLNISYNNLKSINFVKRMTKQEQFDASYNQISSIDAIQGFAKLVDLRLDGNMIESFSAIDSLPNKKAGWYISEQQVQESNKISTIVKECLKSPIGTNFRFQDKERRFIVIRIYRYIQILRTYNNKLSKYIVRKLSSNTNQINNQQMCAINNYWNIRNVINSRA
ncbi:leucine-rich_repeat protein [Hexamita inflata]|uniref:Leucine-rich repeat protein n=1 Tax=Hexamita inflata TaxID=28002 RepID=A0AA86TMQ4_9EUKA|nr:leucine-rich repeat protein [Hexamita inflata]